MIAKPDKQSIVRGACPHDCPDTCATLVTVQDGIATGFTADPDHAYTDGWLCAKVRPYLKRVYSPERLLYPMRRSGTKGSGAWQRVSWDSALEEIATRWQDIIRTDGAAAILPYSFTGTLGLVQNRVASARLWNRMGASGLDRNMCDAAVAPAVMATLGGEWSIDPVDVADSRMIVIWGHNPASTSPHFMPLLRAAQRNGCFVAVIDPRRTLTARSADLHLQPLPGTDTALALAMMHVIFSESLHDEKWLGEFSLGWEALRDRASDFSPERTALVTGVPPEQIVEIARRYATTKPALIKFNDGLQRQEFGGQTVRSVLALPAVVGQYGQRGGGILYSQSSYIPWDAEAIGHGSACPDVPRVIPMNRLGAALTGEVTDPPIRSLFVFAANPMTSTPNASLIDVGLRREDLFTVVHEQFMTDTAQLADIVLPATTQLEQTDLHRPSGHRHLQYNPLAIPASGESRSNWDVMRSLARVMGFTEPWLFEEPDSIIAEVLDATRRNTAELEGVTLERLKSEGTVAYVVADRQHPMVFGTPSGKVELYCEAMINLGVDPLPNYETPREYLLASGLDRPLIMVSGAPHHFVSSSMANQPDLMEKEGPAEIEMHPDDAAVRAISNGELVEASNGRGTCQFVARVTNAVRTGVVIAPKGHWAQHANDRRNVNWLTSDGFADLGRQAVFHSNLVSVRPVTPGERAPQSLPESKSISLQSIPAD